MSGLTPQVLAEITTLGKTVLLIVAITFIVWALYTAMIYPKKHPDFPRDLNLFIVVTAVLFVAQMGAVVWVTGTQEVEHEATSEEHGQPPGEETTGGETTEQETTAEETTAEETTAEETTDGATTGDDETETETSEEETTTDDETTTSEGAAGDPVAGKEVFETAGCVSCHTLADAGATGTIGPNLDDARPTAELVTDRVTNGKGQMPSFSDSLDAQQIADVAAYVSSVAGTS